MGKPEWNLRPESKEKKITFKDRQVMHMSKISDGEITYNLEISKTDQEMFVIARTVIPKPETIMIRLNNVKATKILKVFKNDYHALAAGVEIREKQMLITKPEKPE